MPAAVMAFDRIKEEETQYIQNRMGDPEFILLDGLVRYVVRHLELDPLKMILKETGNLLYWGKGMSGTDLLTLKCLKAYKKLKHGSAEESGEHMSRCFCHILDFARDHMVEFRLSIVERLITP